ncbi:MAG: DUF1905 domain-containing protein [Flavobacteriales bacterium]|nr:DUF1905 domain-containing protein [Flavobacteriales bacterium]
MKETIIAQLEDQHSSLWGFHFRIPDEIANSFVKGKDRRVICTFNGAVKNHCAIMSSQEGPFIMLNRALVKQLKIQIGDKVKLEIEKDISEFGMPISEEFEAIILGDQEVFQYFDPLTPGKKRNLIHLINKIKSSEIKITRSMAISYHLIESKGKIDFKQLNETIKIFNQRNKIN